MIRSTITYREGAKQLSPYESVVGEWAYVKELATMNTRGGGEWSLLGSMLRGNVVGDRKRGTSIVRKMWKNVTGVLVS